jgi:hypothetical protein
MSRRPCLKACRVRMRTAFMYAGVVDWGDSSGTARPMNVAAVESWIRRAAFSWKTCRSRRAIRWRGAERYLEGLTGQ